MSERDFAMALALLAESMGEQKLTPVRIEAYHRGLKDVPLNLLQATVDRLIQTVGSDTFRWTALPPVADIRRTAEGIRRELLALHQHTGCVECEDQRGFRTVLGATGQKVVERCPCKSRHQEKLERLGLVTPLAALPAAPMEEPEPESPPLLTVGQLPAGVQEQVKAIARSKAL